MSAGDAQDDVDQLYAQLWDMVALEPVTIESAGKPIAVVLSPEAYRALTRQRSTRRPGCGRHLLSGAGIDVEQLLATPVQGLFADHMPD